MNSFLKQLSEYRYPSVDELEDIQNKSPDLHKFGFTENDILPGAEVDFLEHKKISDLYNWDKTLESKIIDLQRSYVYTLVHYNRGIPLTTQEYINKPLIRPNHDNLKFYITYLHYITVSIVDNISQIINIFNNLGIKENEVNVRTIKKELKKVNKSECITIIEKFYKDFKPHSTIRNSLAHRFSAYEIDRRLQLSTEIANRMIIGDFNNEFPNYKLEILEIEESFEILKSYIMDLKVAMNMS